MSIRVRQFSQKDVLVMNEIWNEIVRAGDAFPQETELDEKSGYEFFKAQSYCGVAEDENSGEILGLYILHPNNIGRCGHISNASYAVKSQMRGRHIGEMLVRDCMEQGKKLGFRILQFNAVVKTNTQARKLYEKIGFTELGTIYGGFRMKDGHYEDIVPYYCVL